MWTQDILTDRELAMIAEFEITHESDNSVFVHSSPYEPDKWHYILKNEDAANAFDYFSGPLCFYGHTHLPMIYSELPGRLPRRQAGHDFDPMEDSRYLVNVGSVGQPRDNDPRACFVTYDTEVITVEYHRVEYDIAKAQAKMTQFQLPTTLIERLAIGR